LVQLMLQLQLLRAGHLPPQEQKQGKDLFKAQEAYPKAQGTPSIQIRNNSALQPSAPPATAASTARLKQHTCINMSSARSADAQGKLPTASDGWEPQGSRAAEPQEPELPALPGGAVGAVAGLLLPGARLLQLVPQRG
jgi:hypothetical protein